MEMDSAGRNDLVRDFDSSRYLSGRDSEYDDYNEEDDVQQWMMNPWMMIM